MAAKATPAHYVELMVKLVTAMKSEHDKLGALIDEFDNLLAGKASVGMVLKELYRVWSTGWLERHRTAYAWRMDRDAPQMKRLLKLLGQDELTARMVTYLKSDDPFWSERKHPFGLFVTGVNSITGLARNSDESYVPVVAGCLHSPTCTSDQQHTKARMREMGVAR